MKRIICLILFVSLFFSYGFFANAITNENAGIVNNNEENFANIELMSVRELNEEVEKYGINIESSAEYNVSLLIEVKDELPLNGENLLASDINCDDDINKDLLEHRRKVKEYYISHNEEIAKKLSLDEYTYFVSFFAPYIEVSFDDLLEYSCYENTLLDTLQKNMDLICFATVSVVLTKGNATVNTSNYEQAYYVEQAYYDIGVFETSYTGEGIKVGTIEPGAPDTNQYLKSDKYVFLRETRSSHCTAVTSIIGGYYGIAKDVYLYCLPMSNSVVDDLNVLIGLYDVNIVNMSSSYQICGYYSNWDACVDKIIASTGCTVVISAGNQSDDETNTYMFTAPACSMNAITVGSIDYNGNISNFSSWKSDNTFLYKPDVVAPGGNITGLPGFTHGWSGTSFAAPMLTGTIALLMQEFPVLKNNPSLVKSVVQLGAEKLPSQISYFEEKAGFGLINYQNMRDCLINQRYWEFYVPTGVLPGDVLSIYNFATIPYLGGIEINVNLLVNSNVQEENINQATPHYSNLTIKIYDKSTSQCVASSTIDSSVDYLTFINYSQTNSFFVIEIITEDNNTTGASQKVAVAHKILSHSAHEYNNYEYYSDSSHTACCICGDEIYESHTYGRYFTPNNKLNHNSHCDCGHSITQRHVVDVNSGGSGLNQWCKYCGELLFGSGTLDGVYTDYPHTENGSYILPSGIIVLVPEDEEAYLNGTLEFRTGEIM